MSHETSPLPWRVGPYYKCDIESSEGRVAEGYPLYSPRGTANVALIVRAVNHHEALVTALTAVLACDRATDCLAGNDDVRTMARAAVVQATGRED